MQTYGQYCPLALATELLCQRWTILVISRLMDGCSTFSEIHRGVPRISPSMLSQRLKKLEEEGLLTKRKLTKGYSYHLTEAGESLTEIV
ncbi:MAG: helix-turn-helix transcriptional regulator, partial [Rhodothermales bacterium]|nr:helix-turn-helix transcriptional regulator [Rhodothermales bacterium]